MNLVCKMLQNTGTPSDHLLKLPRTSVRLQILAHISTNGGGEPEGRRGGAARFRRLWWETAGRAGRVPPPAKERRSAYRWAAAEALRPMPVSFVVRSSTSGTNWCQPHAGTD